MKNKCSVALLAAAAICTVGCAKVEISSNDVIESASETVTESVAVTSAIVPETTTYVKKGNNCPVEKIGFYLYHDGVRTRKDGYVGPFIKDKDIVEYQIFMTDEEELSGAYFHDVWYSYMDKYPGGMDYKIGYQISFDYEDPNGNKKTVNKFIFSPKDTEEYFDYIQTWMYDDTHKALGQWYSHVTEDEMTDEVRLTAIKFTGGELVDKVSGDITLTVFLYKDDQDFSDDKTEFIGNTYKTIHYKRQQGDM